MSDDNYVACSTCQIERLESTLNEHGMCPFCVDEGKTPPKAGDQYPEVVVRPRKQAEAATEAKPRTPKALRPENQATVDEAFAISYAPPAFDKVFAEASPQREMAMRTLCRRRFLPFVQRFRPKYLAGWVHEDICRRLERFVRDVEAGKEPRMLLMMPPRSGKLLADDTPVPTPRGWQLHGMLSAGDEVFHPSGKAVTIVATSPKDVANVKMTFSDGSSYFCHENHEWVLFDRKRGEWKTLEAGHFLRPSHIGMPPKLVNGTRHNYQLPVVAPLEYRNSFYTMHPYALGAWLGDGSAGNPCITGDRKDKAIIDKIESLGYPVSTVCEHSTTGVLTTYFSGPRPNVSGRMTLELQRLGIYKQKRIPLEYQHLRTDLRLELLAGLIDTDGTTDKNSRITITTVNKELATDILDLVEGLGMRPYMQEVQPALSTSGIQGMRACYVVGFQPTMDIPVALERKRVTRFAKQRRVGLVSVERVDEGKVGNCIQVDSPDGLYVVGTHLTATHNSELGSRHFPAWVLGQHPEWEIIAASHTSSLTLSFSRYIRDLIRDPAYQVLFPEMRLDPSSQSVENWNTLAGGGYLAAGVGTGITGRGCLAPYTLIDTTRGKIRIIDLKVGDSVYGYDHKQEKVVATRVKALQITERSKPLLDCGDIRLTTDHRIYNASTGNYTSAGERPRLFGLRRQEGATRCNMQSVLFQSADGGDHSAQMRLLWQELHAQRSGAPEVPGSTRRGSEGVLQSPMLRPVQDQQPGGVQQGEGRVPALSEAGHRHGSFEVLQQGLLQRVQGFETADGCVQWRVSDPEEAGITAGQEVPAVRYDPRSVRGTPHQPGRDGQQDFESGAALHGVPPQISSVHGACAADIAELFEPFDFVVDIQTGTGNFFTEGLLVHNCHILLLDDLVKDIEAADSVTIKENTWEWYGSTAYTRLAPGGGVLGIMCMTGDTPVMMADGSCRRLDSLSAGDAIATYACGLLAETTVAAMKSSGLDSVYRIKMRDGKIVRANQRHPFLTVLPTGEVTWTRLKNLTAAHRIVTVKDSGVSGEGLSVLPRGARSLPNLSDFVESITTGTCGSPGTALPVQTTSPGATHDSSTATASRPLTTTRYTTLKEAAARFVESTLKREIHQHTGQTSSQSTTVTKPERSEVCSATTATPGSDTLEMSQWHFPPQGISDFTLNEIVSIEYAGEEEVFDVQVNHTENFIANGLVSHNTWWNEDDWAGRIQQVMASGEGDSFEVVRYPAINEEGDEYLLPDDSIVQILPGELPPDGAKMTRPVGTAIHPARYTTEAMLRIKRNLVGSGQKRVWNALYQQNPTPDDGTHFTKEMVQYFHHAPQRRHVTRFQAWDFAITEQQKSDYTVCCTVDQDEHNNLYVIDVFRFRSDDGNAIVEHMIDQIVSWGPDFLGVEDGQIWKTLRAQFETRCAERQVFQSYEVLQPLTDKIVRAAPLKGRMQLKKVFIHKDKRWTEPFVRELMVFPGGKHDDQVDAASWVTRLTLNHMPKKPPPPPRQKSWRDKLNAIADGTTGSSHMSA